MILGYMFAGASGTSKANCHWLGYRFDEDHGFSPNEGDSWICQTTGNQCHSLMSQRGCLTGIWRTDSCVWISELAGRVYMNPSLELRKETFQTFELKATLQGIWGLRDDLVFTWGMRQGAPVAFLYGGTDWAEITAPGLIGGVRGVRDDLIYAVGQNGLIARWDGMKFNVVHSPINGNLTDVFVVSEDEMFACGTDGHLLIGTIHGWEELLKFDSMLYCIAKWGDYVWIGAGAEGLFFLKEEQLNIIKPSILAERFDTRENLLITAPNMIAETSDGANFQATFVKTLADLSAHESPSWRP